MAYLTYSEIKSIESKIQFKDQIIKQASKSPAEKNVFLSYSSRDDQYVRGVIEFLNKFSARVYIDKKDMTLPSIVSEETANILAYNICKIPKFVILVSKNSKESKWVPWELGLAHGSKDLSNIALLPISDVKYEEEWPEQEYLGLYQKVKYISVKGYSEKKWVVTFSKGDKCRLLEKWLS